MRFFKFVVVAGITFIGTSADESLAAPDQIGLAVTVRNDVSRIEPTVAKILAGDDIVRDEVVRTLHDSGAKFVLKDSTNLILGPNSTLKLDRAVFTDEKTVGDIAIKLSTGSFRFMTGNSAKDSYAINTPIATMGIRGTTLDILIERFKNTVVLQHGEARVCAGGACIELLKVGDTAVVTANGPKVDIKLQSLSSWSFEANCSGMCGQTTFAEAENAITTGSVGTGGASGGGGGGGGPTTTLTATAGASPGASSTVPPNSPGNLLTGGFAVSGAISASVSPTGP
ncbi:MAG: FecR domain-containing protein [Rhizobiales bacterium]|nr:FecR domain-containing protein [Hyphomicrobiales bacterium]